MPSNARVFARVMDWADPIGSSGDGIERVRVEWAVLHGSREKGKSIYTLTLSSKNKLASDLMESLVGELNIKFPTRGYGVGDVLLWGA
jgi:hypothetical protein